MEAVTRPRAAEPGVVLALQRGHLLLRGNGAQVEHGVGVFVLTNDLARVDVAHRVERHHHGLRKRQGLQLVEQVVQAHTGAFSCAFAVGLLGALIVPGGPGGAALQETINRILSISVVHEFLSQQDEEVIDVAVVARNIFNVIIDNMLDPSVDLKTSFEGGTIILPSWQATSIALMINELTQNAIEHAFIGRNKGFIGVRMTSDETGCGVEIYDDGIGLPENFTIGSSRSLGLQIVRTLVESDLGGTIRMFNDKGTHAVIWIPKEKEGKKHE